MPAVEPAPAPTVEVPGLACSVELDRTTWAPGETIRGRVRFRNLRLTAAILHTARPVRAVLTGASGAVVGGFTGPTRGTGRRADLAPGAEHVVDLVAGSDSVDPRGGAVLAAGRYLLVARVRAGLGAPLDAPQGTIVPAAVPILLADTEPA